MPLPKEEALQIKKDRQQTWQQGQKGAASVSNAKWNARKSSLIDMWAMQPLS